MWRLWERKYTESESFMYELNVGRILKEGSYLSVLTSYLFCCHSPKKLGPTADRLTTVKGH